MDVRSGPPAKLLNWSMQHHLKSDNERQWRNGGFACSEIARNLKKRMQKPVS